jgi:hypothetical protein
MDRSDLRHMIREMIEESLIEEDDQPKKVQKRVYTDEELKKVYEDYLNLKTKSKADLVRIWKQSYKVGTPESADKQSLIFGILEARYGERKVESALAKKYK